MRRPSAAIQARIAASTSPNPAGRASGRRRNTICERSMTSIKAKSVGRCSIMLEHLSRETGLQRARMRQSRGMCFRSCDRPCRTIVNRHPRSARITPGIFFQRCQCGHVFVLILAGNSEHTILGIGLVLLPPARYVIPIKPRTISDSEHRVWRIPWRCR